MALLFAGLVASAVGAALFVVAVLDDRQVAAYLASALTVAGALLVVTAAVISRRRALVAVAVVAFVPVSFVAWAIWTLATDTS
jgi:hypothetical protein